MHYNQNPQTKTKLDEAMQVTVKSFESKLIEDLQKPTLSKEDALKYVKIMEERKLDSIVKLQNISRSGAMMDQMQANQIMEIEKIKSFD